MQYGRFFVGFIFITMGIGCASFLPQSSPAENQMRIPAQEALVWVQHPCRISGAPYKKYSAFAFDQDKKILLGKKNDQDSGTEIKGRYTNVDDFFNQAGITQFCQNGGGQSEQPAPSDDEASSGGSQGPAKNVPFVTPLQLDENRYYASLNGLMAESADVRVGIRKFLVMAHLQREKQDDVLVEKCPAQLNSGEICVQQIDYGNNENFAYEAARQRMMGVLDLRQLPVEHSGQYQIFDHYCRRWQGEDYFVRLTGDKTSVPGPMKIVSSRVMNCEHSWPQSKFVAKKGSHEFIRQKTDLHHIFSTDTKANADRSNYEFAEVNPAGAQIPKCEGMQWSDHADVSGDVSSGGMLGSAIPIDGKKGQADKAFEPPKGFKGQIARALFYFSVRYNAGMSSLQEAYLRRWNKAEPVSAAEAKRNQKAYLLSGVRNPFVDMPELADRVLRFCRVKGGPNDGQGKSDLASEYCE